MKTLKRAEQQNVVVNKYFYTELELREMMSNETIFYINEDFEISFDFDRMWDNEPRICLNRTKEIKVVYNKEIGMYTNVVVTNEGKEIYITL